MNTELKFFILSSDLLEQSLRLTAHAFVKKATSLQPTFIQLLTYMIRSVHGINRDVAINQHSARRIRPAPIRGKDGLDPARKNWCLNVEQTDANTTIDAAVRRGLLTLEWILNLDLALADVLGQVDLDFCDDLSHIAGHVIVRGLTVRVTII